MTVSLTTMAGGGGADAGTPAAALTAEALDSMLVAMESWLHAHLESVAAVAPGALGIVCAELGIDLHHVAPAHLPLDGRVALLLEHLVHTGSVPAFARALLHDEVFGAEAAAQGLGILLAGTIAGTPENLTPHIGMPVMDPELWSWGGRSQELVAVRRCLEAGARVVALTGPAGCGRSVLLQRWLIERNLLDPASWAAAGLNGVVLWSFTYEPDVPGFLRTLATAVCPSSTASILTSERPPRSDE